MSALFTPDSKMTQAGQAALVAQVAQAIESACQAEVSAFKPGNVSLTSSGHGMSAEQFLLSARAIAAPMAKMGLSVGERILAGVKATHDVVDCNTNLGIILLFSPLITAFYSKMPAQSLQDATQILLKSLTVVDAEAAFTAIALANPGGLGDAQHDVRQKARITLLAAMMEATARDTIAQAYSSGYHCQFGLGRQSFDKAISRWGEESWGVLACYLAILAEYPDSHIARKYGLTKACAASEVAAHWRDTLDQTTDPQTLLPGLMEWDSALKQEGVNPGTSADHSAAVLLIKRLEALQ
jgi:triphosphoribosyl-dephospho-CoA synthase